MDILSKIQFELVALKGQRNNFGKYNYRSCEDILEGLKPLIDKYNVSVVLSDNIKMVGDRIYVVATAKLVKAIVDDPIKYDIDLVTLGESTAFAREPKDQKGMNEAQITGSASSYARKYALNGLFAIDDNKDADTDEHQNNAINRTAVKPVETVRSTEDKIRYILNNWKMPEEDRNKYKSDLRAKTIKFDESLLKKLEATYA